MIDIGEFQNNMLEAVEHRGSKDVADVVGMPDKQDYEVLVKIFQRFERKYPGYLKAALQAGRSDYETGVHAKNSVWTGKATVSQKNNINYVFELPAELYIAIEKVFPSMFRSKKHFNWFKQQFPRLTITGSDK